MNGPEGADGVEAQQALAFVARRAGTSSMEPSRWSHVMSLELGWMPPGQAARYVQACSKAGLLVEDEDRLSLGFDAKSVQIPRGFKPDPERLPAGGSAPAHRAPAAASANGPDARAGPQRNEREEPAAEAMQAEGDLFSTWLPKVAAARSEDISATLEAVERQQEASGGLLHAEPALLRLGAEAGLDVREAARQALNQLRA